MTQPTLAQILDQMQKQLQWRSLSGDTRNHVSITRQYAEALHQKVIALINERDAYAYENEQRLQAQQKHKQEYT